MIAWSHPPSVEPPPLLGLRGCRWWGSPTCCLWGNPNSLHFSRTELGGQQGFDAPAQCWVSYLFCESHPSPNYYHLGVFKILTHVLHLSSISHFPKPLHKLLTNSFRILKRCDFSLHCYRWPILSQSQFSSPWFSDLPGLEDNRNQMLQCHLNSPAETSLKLALHENPAQGPSCRFWPKSLS